MSLCKRPSAVASEHRLSARSPAELYASQRKWNISTYCMLAEKANVLKLSMTD